MSSSKSSKTASTSSPKNSLSTTTTTTKTGDPTSCHLCVFVHGLWGQPSHLARLAGALRDAFPDEMVEILIAENNIGNSTYDGIELGGERVTKEIEDHIAKLKEQGKKVEKFSITGYSLGGLVARYVVGLLYSRGVFETIKPMNFTTFATPHLGTRTPLTGWQNEIFNNAGAKTLAATGTQLWCVDSFRDTKRPLLAVMADPNSIFVRGISSFKKRSLYANIINDRAVPYYTAMFSKTDPFVDLDAIDIHYIDGYDNVILDSSKNLATKKKEQPTYWQSWYNSSSRAVSQAPMYLLFGVAIPIGLTAYMVNSGVQSWRSAQRVRLHEEGKLGDDYRSMPYMIQAAQQRAEQAMENVLGSPTEEYAQSDVEDVKPQAADASEGERSKKEVEANKSEFPTLALTTDQFDMIDNLDAIGWEKYAVHIQKAGHSHAAIIVRSDRAGFADGRTVFRHWTERFQL